MKIIAPLLLFSSVLLAGCGKRDYKLASVVRDCTGSYLRMDEKDYRVCNATMLETYAEGSLVQACFDRIGECASTGQGTPCKLLHEHEGWINLTRIKAAQ